MSFAAPQFLLLLPVWLLLGWGFRSLGLARPLRAALLLLLTLILCDPQVGRKSNELDLWVLFDRSRSAQDLIDAGEVEWRSLLERSRPSSRDALRFLDFATEVIPTGSGEGAIYTGNRDQTLTGFALQEALARLDPRRHNRLLLFSDGYSTEPLSETSVKLLEAGIPLDIRLVRAPSRKDWRVVTLDMPERVQRGEPFLVDLSLAGSPDGLIPIEIRRGDQSLHRGEVQVKGGRGHFQFSDRLVEAGAHRYAVVISPPGDTIPGNNRRERWIEVSGGPRLLLVSAYPDDPLAEVLQDQGFELSFTHDARNLDPGALLGARAVILNNVPAHEVSADFLGALDFFVREQGGGLMMVGGRHSFGAGGYHQSAIDALLPVTMELKSEHRKLGVAMAIVLDRSGSMSMITPSGQSKMHLAAEGAARAVDLLGELDALTVYAVDSSAHQAAPLLNVGKYRKELMNRLRRVESMGGGIFVYEGLQAAWEELKKASLGQRHVILFSDASDSEEPGEYEKLLREMREGGTTVSVIGLGSSKDSDAALLEDIAHRGEGRIFFTEVPGEIPNLFAQETVAVARSTFVKEETPTGTTGRWHELARGELNWLGEVDGYNLSYLRDGDEAALLSTDHYAAPLVSFGRRGIGRTAAVSFPLGGEFSERVRAWPQYGDFVQTLARWLMGDELPPGLGLRQKLEGSVWKLDLHYESEPWESRFAKVPPRLVVQTGYRDGLRREVVWERIAPGHYGTSIPMETNGPGRAALQLGDTAIPLGPVIVGAEEEWQMNESRVAELRELSRSSGGGELVDLSQAWRRPSRVVEESLRSPLLAVLLLLFVFEAFVTRTGWQSPRLAGSVAWSPWRRRLGGRRRRLKPPGRPAGDVSEAGRPAIEPIPAEPIEPAPENEEERRKNRYRRAKRLM